MTGKGWVRDHDGRYQFMEPAEADQVLSLAATILADRLRRSSPIERPSDAADFLKCRIGLLEHEVFGCLWLDNRHRLVEFEILFTGTISGASVYPREVVKRALSLNAAAVIFGHNHPSGVAEPSDADVSITRRLKEALALVEVRVLDHLVVSAGEHTSLSERGVL